MTLTNEEIQKIADLKEKTSRDPRLGNLPEFLDFKSARIAPGSWPSSLK